MLRAFWILASVSASLLFVLGVVSARADDPYAALRGKAIEGAEIYDTMQKKLDEKTELEFIEAPLCDVVEFLGNKHQITIQIDAKALDEGGIAIDTPITRNLRDISLRAGLRLMLRELEATYIVRDEVLLITTHTAAESFEYMQTCVYPVHDLVRFGTADADADYEALSRAIGLTIATDKRATSVANAFFRGVTRPNGWQNARGDITILAATGEFVIQTSDASHEQINKLLRTLRQVRDAQKKDVAKPGN